MTNTFSGFKDKVWMSDGDTRYRQDIQDIMVLSFNQKARISVMPCNFMCGCDTPLDIYI